MRVKIEAILPVISAPISLRPGLKLRAGEDNIVIVDIDDDGVLLNNLRTNGY